MAVALKYAKDAVVAVTAPNVMAMATSNVALVRDRAIVVNVMAMELLDAFYAKERVFVLIVKAP